MKGILLACASAFILAAPVQAAANITGIAEITHSWGSPDPSKGEGSEGPFLTQLSFRVDSQEGQSSHFGYCDDCLYTSFVGNTLVIQDNGLLPCYCSESYSFTFDRDVSAGWQALSDAIFVSGSASFVSAHHNGYESWSGPIVAAWLPEPSTWALMLAGFGRVGGLTRRTISVAFA